jgi:hypothetical protein
MVESLLHAVAMVGVYVKIDYTQTLLQQRIDGNNRVVEKGESGGTVPMGMVPAPGKIEGGIVPLLSHESGSGQSTTDTRECPFVHPFEYGVFSVTQSETKIGTRLIGSAELPQAFYVFRGVESGKLMEGWHCRGVQGNCGKIHEPIVCHQPAGQEVPFILEGMGIAEAVL